MQLYKWSKTAAQNNAAVPDGAPEGWAGADANDWGRETMASARTHAEDAAYIDPNYQLAAVGTKSLSRISTTQFKILACDATAFFTTDRRIRVVGGTTDHGFVTSSSYSAPDTTVNVVMDSGDVPATPTQALVCVDASLRGAAFKKPGTGNGLDADLLDGLHATGLFPRGLLHGRFEYTSATTVTLKRGYYQKVLADVAGVLLESSSDLTWTWSDLDTGAEANSTWYYCYLWSNAGVLDTELSVTALQMDPASGVVGYKTGDATRRFVAAFYNDASGNVLKFDRHADGWTMIREAPFANSPSTGSVTAYTTQALTAQVPASARAVRIEIEIDSGGSGNVYYIGPETLTGTASPTNRGPCSFRAHNLEVAHIADVAVDSTPAVSWAHNGAKTLHTIRVIGWLDEVGIIS